MAWWKGEKSQNLFFKKKIQCRIMRWEKKQVHKKIWCQSLLAYKTHNLGYWLEASNIKKPQRSILNKSNIDEWKIKKKIKQRIQKKM